VNSNFGDIDHWSLFTDHCKIMPKLKTRKAAAKRVKISARKKVIHRTAGQGHFNSREAGKATRSKRSDAVAFKTDAENILKNLPYGN